MRHYPTDLLLAVETVEQNLANGDSSIAVLLRQEELEALVPLLRSAALALGLDELLGSLHQYPWQPLPDRDDVCQLTPVGTVTLNDDDASKTLRGLMLAWANGNSIQIRTPRASVWEKLTSILRQAEVPLPEVYIDTPESSARGVAIEVPVARGIGGEESLADYAESVWLLDCRSAWARSLSLREHLVGTRLSQARHADDCSRRLDAKIRYLVGRARRTSYYSDLPITHGLVDLPQLPILEKSSLEANSLPNSRALCTDDSPSGEVLRSGATSGSPRYVMYSRSDWESMIREAVPLFYDLGLSKGDRLINTLFGGSMYGGLITSVCELSRMPVECYSTGQVATVEDILMLVRDFRANAVLGVPVLIMPLLRTAKSQEPALKLEKVFYGGTPMTESDKQWLRENLGTTVISSVFAANDGAQLGFQCPAMSGTLHHICDDYNLIEVVDDTGRPVPDGEPGHLLITSMQKFEGPLIRYQIGDWGRVFQHDCPCGLSGRVLEYLGRADGQIKAKGRTVFYHEILDSLKGFEISQLQVEVCSLDGIETVVIRTESPRDVDSELVHKHLAAEFEALSDNDTFDASVVAFQLLVECYREGQLDRNPVSGKIKPVIDGRV